MKDRPLGHNPWFAPVQPTDRTPNPDHDDDDQKALRAFGRKLDQLMYDADIGGVLLLSSKKSMSWVISFPRWSGLTNEGLGIRLRTKMGTPEGAADASATLGYIANVRDLTFEIHGFFSNFFRKIEKKSKEKGNDLAHTRLGSAPGHMGPWSGAKAQAKDRKDAMFYDPKTCTTAGELRSYGAQLDPGIPDAAWVETEMIRRVGEVTDPEMKLQIWAPFRWISPDIAEKYDDEDPPLIEVRRPADDDSSSTPPPPQEV